MRRSEEKCRTNVNAVNVRLRFQYIVFYYFLAETDQSSSADFRATLTARPASRLPVSDENTKEKVGNMGLWHQDDKAADDQPVVFLFSAMQNSDSYQ